MLGLIEPKGRAMTSTVASVAESRHTRLDVCGLEQPAALIFNPNSGQKLGMSTNAGGADEVQATLRDARIPFDPWPTERAGHATELAQKAVSEGRSLVIAAGGDGTAGEVAQALAGTDIALGIMPLGSVMNVARTLCIPRDLPEAARVIAGGQVLAIDLGKVGDVYFLEAAGVGLDAGLFGYFEQLESKGLRKNIIGAALRFVRGLGTPRLVVQVDGRTYQVRAPMVAVANGPFVGAAYALAPDARVDDGLLDVVIFHGASVPRMLFHLLAVAGGRRLGIPPEARMVRGRSVRIAGRRSRRTLPVHADGTPVGATPIRFEVVPSALRVIVGAAEEGAACAWGPPVSAAP
jgi:YegS/Rv2252/BmrU family lipid kinase